MRQEIAKLFFDLAKIIFALGIVSLLLKESFNLPAIVVSFSTFTLLIICGVYLLKRRENE